MLDLHARLQVVQIFIIRGCSDQDRVFRLQNRSVENRSLVVAFECMMRLVNHDTNSIALFSQVQDQIIDTRVLVARRTNASPVLDSCRDQLPLSHKHITAASTDRIAVFGERS